MAKPSWMFPRLARSISRIDGDLRLDPTGRRADGSLVSRMADNPKGKGYGVHLDHGKLHVNLTSVWADDAIRMETEDHHAE